MGKGGGGWGGGGGGLSVFMPGVTFLHVQTADHRTLGGELRNNCVERNLGGKWMSYF